MTKSDDRRDSLLEKLTDHVLAHGLGQSSLRPLAKAAGLSDRMLLYYFKDKDEIISAVLMRVAQRLTVVLSDHVTPSPLPLQALIDRLTPIMLDDALWPYLCLWLEIASLAARGDTFYQSIGHEIGLGFLAWGAAQLTGETPAQREKDALALLVHIEGSVLLKSLGIKA
jgi:AcrR family transcriptional regulator